MIPAATDGERVYALADDSLVALATDDGSEQWRYPKTQAGIIPGKSGDENVYAVQIGGSGFVALDPETGAVRWRNSVADVPLVTDTHIFAVGETLSALSPTEGTVDWTFEPAGDITNVVASAGSAFVGSSGSLHAVRRMDGEERRRFEVPDPHSEYRFLYPLAVDAGSSRLYVWDVDQDSLFALDLEDGRKIWGYEVDDEQYLYPGVLTETMALHVEGSDIVSVALSDGVERWRVDVGEEPHQPLRILGDSVVLHTGRRVRCIAIEDGTKRWVFETDQKIRSTEADEDLTLVVGADSESKQAVRLSATDGSILWSFDADTEHLYTLTANGRVYAGTEKDLWLLATPPGAVAETERLVANNPAGLLAGSAIIGALLVGAYRQSKRKPKD